MIFKWYQQHCCNVNITNLGQVNSACFMKYYVCYYLLIPRIFVIVYIQLPYFVQYISKVKMYVRRQKFDDVNVYWAWVGVAASERSIWSITSAKYNWKKEKKKESIICRFVIFFKWERFEITQRFRCYFLSIVFFWLWQLKTPMLLHHIFVCCFGPLQRMNTSIFSVPTRLVVDESRFHLQEPHWWNCRLQCDTSGQLTVQNGTAVESDTVPSSPNGNLMGLPPSSRATNTKFPGMLSKNEYKRKN